MAENYGRESWDIGVEAERHDEATASAVADSLLAQGMDYEDQKEKWQAIEETDFNDVESLEGAMSHLENDPVNGAQDFAARALDPEFAKLETFEASQIQIIAETANTVSGFVGAA